MQWALFFSVVAVFPVYSQVPPSISMTAVCAEEMASGFDWKNGKWEPTKFKANDRFHVKRYSTEQIREDATSQDLLKRPLRCIKDDLEKAVDLSGIGSPGNFIRKACYIVKEFGKESMPISEAEVCYESFHNNKLIDVACNNFRFHPNGLFIRLPWETALNVNSKPRDDYKDSLVLSVGKCSSMD